MQPFRRKAVNVHKNNRGDAHSFTTRVCSLLLVACFLVYGFGCGGGGGGTGTATWAAGLAVAKTGGVSVGSTTYESSTKLLLRWSAPSQTIDHYTITAVDGVQSTKVTADASSSSTSLTLTGLKSATSYTVSIVACVTANCSETLTGDASVTGTTKEEVWQVQGTGNTYSTVSKPVSDGNTMPYAFRYGSDASSGLAGKIQLYYNPTDGSEKGIKIALTSSPATTTVSSVASFGAFTGVGLIRPSTAATLVATVNTFQALPLSAALGSKVRLFFEANGADGKARIMYLDSQDGYTGQDFHAGSGTQCRTSADYATGGGCAPTVVIGVEGDAVAANANVTNARQFKIGYPTQDNWRWDGSSGTFMIFTVNPASSCTTVSKNQGYAVWDGSAWNVHYSGSCPTVFTQMQAPMPVHIGGVKYKLYYSDTTQEDKSGTLPSPGPKKIIYADGVLTGNTSTVAYEDWEGMSGARDITTLWPDGSKLTTSEESHLDDYVVLAPTGDLSFQVMYSNMTDGTITPFIGMLVLINP